MRILVVTQYFWPEFFIITDLVRMLEAQGNQVEVFTGKPNYPDGKVFAGYSEAGCGTEILPESSVSVFRAPLRARRGGGAKNLTLNYLSFVLGGLRHFSRQIRKKKFDAILVFAPSPITSVIPAILLKWKSGAHLAVWVQDLWPESMAATGYVTSRLALRVVGSLVRAIYRASDTLLVQSRAFFDPVSNYADRAKLVYYPNSYKEPVFGSTESKLSANLIAELESHFCVVFAGNLGTAQAVETLVDAAERLRHLGAIKLVLVGSGSMFSWLQSQKEAKRLDNLVLAGRYAAHEMPHVFRRAAGLLVTLKRDEAFTYTVPSKVQAYLAAGRPVIAALDGEGARIIEEARAGITCAAEDGAGLARCIEQLHAMPAEQREQMGRAGRAYFLENFEMGRQCRNLVRIIEQRIVATGASR